MSDKPVAAFVTALVVAPLCSVCIFGPAVVGGALAGWFGWLSDIGAVAATALAIIAAVAAYALLRHRHSYATSVFERNAHP